MDGAGFIRELCIALEHRWKSEELFVLFTAYFDESDTHGRSPNMVMTAFLGHAREWELYCRKLRKIQTEEQFTIFHAKEMRSNVGEYQGWDNVKIGKVVSALVELGRTSLTEAFLTYLEYEKYMREYRNSFTPRGVALDSQYGVCFRTLLIRIVQTLFATHKKHKLHVVVERGHVNAKNTERIFNEIKQTAKARGFDLLGTHTLAPKEEAPPLMAADLLANVYAKMRRPGGIGLEGYANATSEPSKTEAGLTFLEFLPQSLGELKLQMQRDRLERRAFSRKQKAKARNHLPSSAAASQGQPS